MKVAIIHDWLLGKRGGEKVLAELCELLPQADIFTLFYKKNSVGQPIEGRKISASSLNRLPGVHSYYRHLLPLFPMAIEKFDLRGYDLVVSSSHCAAKGVLVPPEAMHLCYCHTPIRYAWDQYHHYFQHKKFEWVYRWLLHSFRVWDVTSSERVDHFIANSHWVAKRIKKYYRRNSLVIHPPVDTQFYQPVTNEKSPQEKPYYLIVSAFAPYKRVDLAIEACEKLSRPLVVIGSGQQEAQLRKLKGPNTTFLSNLEQTQLRRYYQHCEALLFPAEEDFGITPVEAQACGKPVIAYGKGGVTETVLPNKTGLFFQEQTIESLCHAIRLFESTRDRFGPQNCRRQALRFSKECFHDGFQSLIEKLQETKNRESSRTLDLN